jgi:hypothetical protein
MLLEKWMKKMSTYKAILGKSHYNKRMGGGRTFLQKVLAQLV